MHSQFGRGSESSILFKFGELTFHDASRQLMHHGVELRLSPQARRILRLLLLSWPATLSRDRLNEELWPSTFFCETTIDELVDELRVVLGSRKASAVRVIDRSSYVLSADVQRVSCPPLVAALVSAHGGHPLYEGENSVGRASDNAIVLNDVRISRHHASIAVFRGRAWLRDLGSTNGTSIGGHSIGASPVAISSSSRISFGTLSASVAFCGSSEAPADEDDEAEKPRPQGDRQLPIVGVPVW